MSSATCTSSCPSTPSATRASRTACIPAPQADQWADEVVWNRDKGRTAHLSLRETRADLSGWQTVVMALGYPSHHQAVAPCLNLDHQQGHVLAAHRFRTTVTRDREE